MSKKDCIRIRKSLKYHIEKEDLLALDAEFKKLTDGGIPKTAAYMEAAETVMDSIVQERNTIAAEVREKGGYMEDITLENIVNPASYSETPSGAAADMSKISADEFDALLEEVAPTPADTTPAPKEAAEPTKTEESVARLVARDRGKKLRKNKVATLKSLAKTAGIEGYSKMNKETVATALESWNEARTVAALPESSPEAARDLRASIYTRADSSVGVVVKSQGWSQPVMQGPVTERVDPALARWARHFGASVEKKADMYEGGKTEKGYHFQGTLAFEKFVEAYTGKTVIDQDRLRTGGETIHVKYAGDIAIDPLATFEVGDQVTIAPEGTPGEVVGFEKDVLGRENPIVRAVDPESGVEGEYPTSTAYLSKVPPPSESAKEALANAAKHGVKGADEALNGLVNLFGGKGKFSSGFTFDEDTYAKAKSHFKKSLEEFVAAGKSLKEFLQFILENFGEGIKPYLKRFHEDVTNDKIVVKGVNDVQPPTQAQTPISGVRTEPADQVDTADARARAAEVPVETGVRPAEEEAALESRVGIPVDSPVDAGEQGNIDLLGETGEFSAEPSTTGRADTRRGAAPGAERVSAETPGSKTAETAARQTAQRQGLTPTTSTFIANDPQNIVETLPALFPEQHDDVAFAEERISEKDERGVIFTNGTGTGKTFTGLGIAKRMVMQGKDNIIIVVPGEKVASDWIKSASAVQLEITKLKNIKDAGTGVVVTTYANFAENNAVTDRNWDLVIHDEAHKLSENMAGEATNALNKSRSITGHPDGMLTYAEAQESDLLDEIKTARSQMKDIQKRTGENEFMTPDQVKKHNERYTELSEKLDALWEIWNTRYAEHRANRQALWESKTPKRLDLSATPFAYEKSVDHAEGFLFEYDRAGAEQNTGYNAPDARGAFMMEHFGYRMRTGKLTQPEADVDSGLMQREFNQWLKGEGALRGRVLTVDHDYSREFIAIDDLVGKKIDEGWDMISKRGRDKENPKQKGYEIMESQLRKTFNYHARVRMLEAIKAKWAVDRAKKHMALGRKVVLFHSRIQGGTMNPFHMFAGAAAAAESDIAVSDEEQALYQAAAAEFVAERNDLMTLDINTVRPLDLFAREFGDQMTTYNGTITNKQKRENPDLFNNDDLQISVIAVQDEGGKEGISLHDATGANQRVLINLGLPVRPTQAIQIEGRIYRVGQMSNAIFEYFNTGTNFERMTFAEKISERASTAENLALGEQARTLKDSFIDAYEDPSFDDPSDGQGVGGKAIDQANWAATSEYERAKTHYFGTAKTKGRRDQREGVDYFPTPEPLGFKMVEWADAKPNDSMLEPSAGHGAIGRYFPENVASTFVEPEASLLSRLALRAPGNHRQIRFEDLDVGGNKFNAIVMNPPYGAGGSTAMAHLHKAMHHLKNGGRVVALIPEGPAADKKFDNMFYGKDGELEALREKVKTKRKAGESISEETRRIEDLTKYYLRASVSMPPVTFTRAGTAIRARVVVIDKMLNDNVVMPSKPPMELHADTINELFDKIEGMEVPARTELEQTPEEYLEAQGLNVKLDEPTGLYEISGKTFEHRTQIKAAITPYGSWNQPKQVWTTPEDPTDALYQEFTNPQQQEEIRSAAPTQADIAAAAAAIMGGRQTIERPTTRQIPVWTAPEQEYKSTDASINRKLNPVTIGIVEKNYGWEQGTVNADIGGGMHDNTIEYLKQKGVDHVVYDPFNRSEEYNARSISKIRDGKADTVTINNTLNVIKEKENRSQVLREAENALKSGGKLYIQVYEGDKSGVGRHTKGDIWQENRTAKDFLTEVQEVFPNAELKYGLVTAQKVITARKPAAAADQLGGLIVTEGKTKTGKQVWEVTGETREHKDMLKALGGRWYGPKKAWSFYDADPTPQIQKQLDRGPLAMRNAGAWDIAVKQATRNYPGYPSMAAQLDAVQADKKGLTPREWLAELDQNPPKTDIYKIGYEPDALRDRRGAGSTKLQVKKWLEGPLKRISTRVPVEIVQRTSDIRTPYDLAPDGLGWYIDGKVYLVADNIRSQKDAVMALTHESVGHLGLEGVLGRKKFNELVGDIVNMKVEEMLNPGTHPELARILEVLQQNYVDEKGNYTLNPKKEAKEVIAAIAESKPRIGPFVEIYNKIMNWFRQALAKLGIVDPDIAMIEDALIRSVDFIKNPPQHYTGTAESGVSAMRAYHGGAAVIEKFQTKYIGTGEGNRSYGWGLYFATQKQVGEYYRAGGAYGAATMVKRHGEVRAQHILQNQIDEAMSFATPNQRYIDYRQIMLNQIRSGEYRGNVYEVELAPTEEEMISWEGELEDQPAIVRNAFQTLLGGTPQEFEGIQYFEDLRGTGGELYRQLQQAIKDEAVPVEQLMGYDPYTFIEGVEADQVASMLLHSMGIRGVQYLDQGSRGLPEQTKNYVVFHEEDITIIDRKGPPKSEPLAMRRRQQGEEQSPQEREAYRKLGLEEKAGLWERISRLRQTNLTEALDSATARGYEGLFDGLIELKRKEIEANVGVGNNDYENSAYVAARLATGIADMMTHLLHYGPLQWRGGVVSGIENTRGLLDLMGDLGVENINDWLLWMGANRAKELMLQGRERNLTEDDIALGLSKAEGKEELFTRIKEEYAAMNKFQLDFNEEAGLIDAVKREEWESEWYVPFYRMSEDEISAPRLKRGLSHQEAGIRRLFGAEIPTNDLLENIITNWLKLTDSAVKNHALRLMIDNFEGKTDLGGQEYITSETMRFTKALVPRSEIRKRIMADRTFAKQVAEYLGMDETANNLQIINEVNQIPSAGFEQLWALTAPKDPDIVRVKRNGKSEYWRVNIPGLLRAVGHISEQSSQSKGMKAGRWFKRLLTTGVTASPDFMLRNFIRDAAHAWAINPDSFKFGRDSVKGLKKALGEGELYQAAMASGASFQGGYVHATDPEASAQILRRELKKAGLTDAAIHAHLGSIINTPQKLRSLVSSGWQHYRTVGDKVENANRIATLQAALDAGKPMAQALFESKDLMDYSRRGNFASLIFFTDLIPFLNARMQGVDKLGRAIKQDKRMVAKKMAYIAAFSVMLAMLNDDDERYQELPDWEKDAYWHFWIDTGTGADGHYRIPKPFEIGIVAGTIPERIYRTWVTESQPSEKLKWSLLHGTMETLNVNPIPQFALPVIEVAANRSFYFDQPIESLTDRGKVLPKERYNAFTSNTAIALGDTALAEWVGVSPKQLQHLWNGYTGTMGSYALKSADMLVRGVGDQPGREAIMPHDVPLVRSFFQGERKKGTQWATDFYDRMEEVRQLHGTMKRYLEQGKREKAREFRAEHADKLKYRRMMEKVQSNFAQLRDKRNKILRNEKLTPTEKYQQSQAVQIRINALAKKIEAKTRPAFQE